MKKLFVITLYAVFFFLPVVVFLVFWWMDNHTVTKITLINNSSQIIAVAEIHYTNQLFQDSPIILTNINPHQEITKKIEVKGDGSFDVNIVFQENTEIRRNNLGYITPNLGSHNFFLITEEQELVFSQE